jgi:hypothetical protein
VVHRRRTLAPSLLSHHCCDRRGPQEENTGPIALEPSLLRQTWSSWVFHLQHCPKRLSLTIVIDASPLLLCVHLLFFPPHSAARTYVCVCFRCGVRLSPHRNGDVYDTYNGCRDPDPDTLYAHAVAGLDKLSIACVALFHSRFVKSFGVAHMRTYVIDCKCTRVPPPPPHTHTHTSSRARAHTSELTHTPAQSRILVRLHARMHAGTCC